MNDHNNPYYLQTAELDWQDGIPCASDFGDVYFSRDDGSAESRYVFLDGNQLAERWRALDANKPGRFTICETGFGTGLNFLLAWQLWQQCAPDSWTLHYISCEKHPLNSGDLAKAHQHWPSLASLAAILQHNYPPLIPGHHRRSLSERGPHIDLLFGDIADTLPALIDSIGSHPDSSPRPVDAWFLDGFAPSANPGMWQASLFDAMARLSKPNASFATFTAAGIVKRGLRERGFTVTKTKGFGRKRDMLVGHFTAAQPDTEPALPPSPLPWHQPAATASVHSVVVVGAGLAGCTTARALAERGLRVTLIERRANPAEEASGNPQGMLYTKLSPEPGLLNVFTLHSFLYALHHYHRIASNSDAIDGEFCGVLQLANSPREAALFKRLQQQLAEHHWLQFVDRDRASALSGIDIRQDGIFYPAAGWLSPPSVCKERIAHPNIALLTNSEALSLLDHGDHWQIIGSGQHPIAEGDAVVIANSHDATQFSQSAFLPLRKIRGQISYFRQQDVQTSPRCVVCHKGYVAPEHKQQLCIGASFDLHNANSEVTAEDHAYNLNTLADLSPKLLKPGSEAIGGRAALRCASPDYAPIVGALPDIEAFDNDYAALRKDARRAIDQPGRYVRNCYVNVAHGSRGLTSTPLAAELLAAYLCNESRPLPKQLCESLSPARFIIRDLMRSKR